MNIPGIIAMHAIVSPTCRANRTPGGAAEEAIRRLRDEYASLQLDANANANFHFVLTVERPERGK